LLKPCQDVGKRQTDQDKNECIEEKYNDRPNICAENACLSSECFYCAASLEQARGNNRQHAGYMNGLGEQIRHVGRDNRQRDLNQRVLKRPMNRGDHVTYDHAKHNATHRRQEELTGGFCERERSRCCRYYRKPVEHESRGIVDQALAFQNGDDSSGQSHPPEHAGDRHRVRGRNNCA